MNQWKMFFAQIINFASYHIFKRFVGRYLNDEKVKELNCLKQFLFKSFAQLTQKESLTDTLIYLKLHADKLYHLDIGKIVDKSTLSRANENRDW